MPKIISSYVANPGHVESCTATLTLAFNNDLATRRLFSRPDCYLETFPHFARAISGSAFSANTVYYTEGFGAVAVWLAPGARSDENALIQIIQENSNSEDMEDLMLTMEEMAIYRPKEPHWYLPMIGCDPLKQGQGHGSAIMEAALMTVDSQKMPAYLESSNYRNIPFYERYGFKVLGVIKHGSNVPITPMLRIASAPD